jgi:hypothetical protein
MPQGLLKPGSLAHATSNAHALIFYTEGGFWLQNQGPSHCAAVRIGIGAGQRGWPLGIGAAFSAGNSVFVVQK